MVDAKYLSTMFQWIIYRMTVISFIEHLLVPHSIVYSVSGQQLFERDAIIIHIVQKKWKT